MQRRRLLSGNAQERKVSSVIPAPVVMEALKDEQQQQNANKQIVGAAWENKCNPVIERANIPPDVRFHDLRHSFAVTSFYSGDDVKTV